MPYDVRCPDCSAKLRLDEVPDRDTPIECPRCGGTFTPAEAAASKAEPKPKKEKKKKVRTPADDDDGPKEREGMNPLLLLGIVGAGLIAYVAVAAAFLHVLSKSGRVTDMIAYVPADCEVARGANLKILSRFPGYKFELDRQSATLKTSLDALPKAAGLDDPLAFYDFVVTGESGAGTVYVIRCREDFDPAGLAQALRGTPAAGAAPGVYQLPPDAPALGGQTVYLPTRRYIVAAGSPAAIGRSIAAAADPTGKSFVGGIGDAGDLAARGHTWTILRATGRMKDQIKSFGAPLAMDKGLTTFAKKTETAKELAMWNSFGSKIRFGAALDCGSSDAASELARTIREGEFGKGDDAELPRGFKQAFPGSHGKEFKALLSGMSFKSSGTAAYYVASLGPDKGGQMLQTLSPNSLGGGNRTP